MLVFYISIKLTLANYLTIFSIIVFEAQRPPNILELRDTIYYTRSLISTILLTL